jgi:membrane-associated phospholipid phosphatase
MRKRTLAAAALAAGALAVGVLSSTRAGKRVDSKAFRAVNRGHGPVADRFFASVTELGSLYASSAAASALALSGERRAATRGMMAAGAMWAVGQALKQTFGRPRPFDAYLEDEFRLMIARPQGTSWPSSHPAVLVAFLTAATAELRLPARQRVAVSSIALVVGASRTYLGVHYPSDVLGGLMLGAAVGTALSPL